MQLTVLIVYSVLLIGLGLWIGRRVESSGAFFVAGRNLSPLLLFSTVLAANIGAGSTVGATGIGYREGLAAYWWVGAGGIGTLLLALWIGPRIWQIARDHELLTVGDFLEHRYGRSVRATISILLWFGTLSILAGQLIAMAWILNVVADIPKAVGCLIGGGVMTIYFAAGGLLTSAWVNLVQLVVLLGGFAIAVPTAISRAGGWETVRRVAIETQPDALSPWGPSSIGYLALLVPAFLVSPGLVQKIYGARSPRAVRLGVGLSALALLGFAAVPAVLGLTARAIAPDLANPELALPTLLTSGLPLALGGLGLAAVFSAEMSSADALLFMLATSLSQDLYKRFVNPEASDRQVLRVARWAALVGGGLAVFLAMQLDTVIRSLGIFYSLLGVSLLVPLIAGLYLQRAGISAAMAGITAGVVVLLGARFIEPDVLAHPAVTPTTMGLAASGVAFGIVRWLVR